MAKRELIILQTARTRNRSIALELAPIASQLSTPMVTVCLWANNTLLILTKAEWERLVGLDKQDPEVPTEAARLSLVSTATHHRIYPAKYLVKLDRVQHGYLGWKPGQPVIATTHALGFQVVSGLTPSLFADT